MGWVKLDDRFPDHPKIEAISDRAFRLHIRGLCYCSEHLTDGRVPRSVAKRLGSLKSLGELIAAGLWADTKDGLWIHDYLEYNPSRQKMQSIRDARSIAARTRWGDANALQPLLGEGEGLDSKYKDSFVEFWRAFPRKQAQGEAWPLFVAVVTSGVDPLELIEAAERYAVAVADRDEQYVKTPANWLRAEMWKDEQRTPRRVLTQEEIDAEVEAYLGGGA